jgi:hypothetical protein
VSNGWFTSKTINNLLFGPEGEKRTRYRDIVGAFNLQKLLILNFWYSVSLLYLEQKYKC